MCGNLVWGVDILVKFPAPGTVHGALVTARHTGSNARCMAVDRRVFIEADMEDHEEIQ